MHPGTAASLPAEEGWAGGCHHHHHPRSRDPRRPTAPPPPGRGKAAPTAAESPPLLGARGHQVRARPLCPATGLARLTDHLLQLVVILVDGPGQRAGVLRSHGSPGSEAGRGEKKLGRAQPPPPPPRRGQTSPGLASHLPLPRRGDVTRTARRPRVRRDSAGAILRGSSAARHPPLPGAPKLSPPAHSPRSSSGCCFISRREIRPSSRAFPAGDRESGPSDVTHKMAPAV